jgi:ribosome-associated translation inhibitor RaiA
MPAFATKTPRSTKRDRGRTTASSTPIAIRGSVAIPDDLERKIRTTLARRVGHAGPAIERGTVRFEDLNGPRGGLDTECRIKLVLSNRPSVNARERASDPAGAFDLASHKVRSALERVRGKHRITSGQRYRGKGASKGGRRRKAAASAEPAANPPDRNLPRLETARLPPRRRAAKSRAKATKQRVKRR